jgi:hypothetical protein
MAIASSRVKFTGEPNGSAAIARIRGVSHIDSDAFRRGWGLRARLSLTMSLSVYPKVAASSKCRAHGSEVNEVSVLPTTSAC